MCCSAFGALGCRFASDRGAGLVAAGGGSGGSLCFSLTRWRTEFHGRVVGACPRRANAASCGASRICCRRCIALKLWHVAFSGTIVAAGRWPPYLRAMSILRFARRRLGCVRLWPTVAHAWRSIARTGLCLACDITAASDLRREMTRGVYASDVACARVRSVPTWLGVRMCERV